MLSFLKRLIGRTNEGRLIETAYAVVDAYGEYFERLTFLGQIIDESELPYAKDIIRKSLLIAVAADKAEEFREAALLCGPFLAYFQPNIGPHPLWSTGHDAAKLMALTKAARDLDIDIPNDTMVQAFNGSLENRQRYEALIPSVTTEADALKRQLISIIGRR